MVEIIKGKVWKFGDNINTDLICPGPLMRLPIDEIGKAAMAGIDPEFHTIITKGDIIVAGENFGSGSSRELAPLALKKAEIAVVVAEYFARIFMRNCISIGFPIMACKGISKKVEQGNIIQINLTTGEITNFTKNEVYSGWKFPKEFLEIFEAGGIIEWQKKNPNTSNRI